jgi:hypothetical protein
MPHVSHPPLYWRRWTFLANALFNLLFALFTLFGVRFSYAAVSGRPSLLGHLISALFWAALLVATVAEVFVAAGWFARSYHRWLDLIMVANMFCFGLIATAELLLSLMLHAGFSEPLMVWLLIIPYQFLTVRSAHEIEPPARREWPEQPLTLPGAFITIRERLAHLRTRTRRAARAFRQTDGPRHERPDDQPHE